MPKMQASLLVPSLGADDLGVPPEDDIPDIPSQEESFPVVNLNTSEGQILMAVDEALFKMSQHAATILASIDKSWDATLRVLNHNNAATMALVEAIQRCVPYSATIATRTVSGFPLTLTVQHTTQQGFFEAMDSLFILLKDGGFTPGGMP